MAMFLALAMKPFSHSYLKKKKNAFEQDASFLPQAILSLAKPTW
jgi:hypothetical protein